MNTQCLVIPTSYPPSSIMSALEAVNRSPVKKLAHLIESSSQQHSSNTTNRDRGLDVLDNKTSEFQQLFAKPIYSMSDIFHREDERLKTFDNWPHAWLDKHELARTGMFFTGDGDKVKCYFCEVEIGRWEEQDLPVPEHMRWSPNCPLLRRRTTNNVPIDREALNQILPPTSYDICGANDAIEIRPSAYAEGGSMPVRSVSTATMTSGHGSSNSNSNATTPFFPEFPEYVIEEARKRSFAMWPRNMKQKPEQLSEAGFFYTGVGDRVKCFSCGGGLKDWDDNDDPWEQHALWLDKCRYLKLVKGQNYIDAVIAKYKATDAAASNEQAAAAECLQSADVLVKPDVTSNAPTELTVANVSVEQPTAEAAPSEALETTAAHTDVVTQKCADTATACSSASTSSCSSIADEKMCKICYAAEYNTAFLPCGHVVACAKCASSVTKCPLCRKPFIDVMRVYFS